MVNGLAKSWTACAMAYGPSMLTQASSDEERLLPSDGGILPEGDTGRAPKAVGARADGHRLCLHPLPELPPAHER